MPQQGVFAVLAAFIILTLVAGCGRTEEEAAGATQREGTVSVGDFIDYEGPETPRDTEWLLESLNGNSAAENSDILLFHDKQELGVEGGCMGFYIVHELEGDRIRVVKPGLQVGRLECGKPEEVRRQAEGILSIMRDLDEVRATEDRFELRSRSGAVALFVPPAPARVDPALAGTEWIATSVNGRELPLEPSSTLEIGEEDLVGFGACNGFGGAIDRMADGAIEWSSQANEGFASTTVGCGGSAGRQEMAYMDALAGAESYRRDGDRLELRNAQGRTTVVLRQKIRSDFDPAVLENTRWRVLTVDGEKPVKGSVPTIEFGQGREATWYDGCEEGSGRYTVTDYELVFRQEGVVEGECMKPDRLANPVEPCVQVCFYPSGNYRLRDGLLEVRSELENKTAILEPLPEGVRLERHGTPWELRYFVENGEKTAVAGEAPITLTFDRGTLRREGTIFGSTGCNDYRAAYEYPTANNTFERIVVDDPVSTRRACPKSQGLAEQEQRFLAVVGDLGEHPTASMDGQLELETRDGRKLVFSVPER